MQVHTSQTLSEVVAIKRSWSILQVKLRRLCIAKKLHTYRAGVYITLEVKKIQPLFGEYNMADILCFLYGQV